MGPFLNSGSSLHLKVGGAESSDLVLGRGGALAVVQKWAERNVSVDPER